MLIAHSPKEAALFMRVNPCKDCAGTLSKPPLTTPPNEKFAVLRLSEPCPACGKIQDLDFAVPDAGIAGSDRRKINTTDEPSRIIDAGQWLTLAQLLTEQSRTKGNRSEARTLAMEAADCLREALKFYDDPENDLPPAGALFSESSRRRFRDAPQQFSRQRILGELRRLPVSIE